MVSKTRIAQLGVWHVHAKDYARDCVNNPDAELYSVWDKDADRARQFASDWNIAHAESIEDVLNDPDIKGVIITTATVDHPEIISAAIAHGKHVYTEKVLTGSPDTTQALIDQAERAGVTLTVSLPRLYTGYTAAIDEILKDGELGDLSYVRVRVSHDGAVRRDGKPQWLPEAFFNRAESLGGAMIDFGAHPYYLVHHFAGMPKAVTAHYLATSGHEVEDQATVICHYPGRLTGVAEASFLGGAMGMVIEIHGSNGTLLFDFDEGLRTRLRGEQAFKQRDIPADGTGPFDRWIERLQRGETDPENTAVALALTQLAHAAEISAAEHRSVEISDGEDA